MGSHILQCEQALCRNSLDNIFLADAITAAYFSIIRHFSSTVSAMPGVTKASLSEHQVISEVADIGFVA